MTVKAAKVTSTGTVVSGPAKVLHVHAADGGTAGSILLKDGGGSGDTLLPIDTPGSTASIEVPVPGGGIAFGTDVHATLSQVTSVTVIYEER